MGRWSRILRSISSVGRSLFPTSPSRINNEKFLKVVYKSLTTKNENSDYQEQSPTPNSHKKEVLAIASVITQREQEKKKKKLTRFPKIPLAQETIESQTITMTPTPLPVSTLFINRTAYEIFQRLFTQNNENEGPWENRSYRSTVSISRLEIKKLIEGLGGRYSKSRGHGSHSLGHLPSINNLPKLELNGEEIGICDIQENELLICLTKAAILKYYQLAQVRNVLIKQGFTPDTVFPK
jgi:hypothetical protein